MHAVAACLGLKEHPATAAVVVQMGGSEEGICILMSASWDITQLHSRSHRIRSFAPARRIDWGSRVCSRYCTAQRIDLACNRQWPKIAQCKQLRVTELLNVLNVGLCSFVGHMLRVDTRRFVPH